ncbi:GGDEF domain-containing protein [Blastococcus sp. VKM Ac-2987]|uniref:GGDEF domain-containing protein n=1 Tax=Blastococcus sp. VKM Ac-2987 TaxID=3004141 RepID=UPI0022AB9CF8|nr:GGDEF domain-containing protein [Blastococcus sp. VKM Ac-2987]MCZ2857261.1 GGDEF domain-containing protein [Blastococcus sp. VKM Ac-2987]
MSHGPAQDRRADGNPPRGRTSPRGVLAALRDGLYRPLAGDDDRVAYWVHHVRIGVVVTELAALAVIGYALLVDGPGHNHPGLLLLTGLTVVTAPTVLLLPLHAMIRDWRGPTLFYGWTLGTAVVVITATRLDGGAASPLDALLFLTLTFMAAAYSPVGVIAMGSAMTAGYLLFIELPGLTTRGLFFVSVMSIFTIVCTMASANSWAAYDRQMLLIRTAEMLASTDALTGIPNRRLFLERVARALDDAVRGRRSVVCLVDLDGFKAVNDADGHAAGDALLVAVGASLGGAIRETDTVARIGGDEFAVLADVVAGRSAPSLAERLREAVALAGARHGVTASVGVAEIGPGDDLEDLMHRADVAMYRAKSVGGDRVSVREG